jgi:hypothetical protein
MTNQPTSKVVEQPIAVSDQPTSREPFAAEAVAVEADAVKADDVASELVEAAGVGARVTEEPTIEPTRDHASPAESEETSDVFSRLARAGIWKDGDGPRAVVEESASPVVSTAPDKEESIAGGWLRGKGKEVRLADDRLESTDKVVGATHSAEASNGEATAAGDSAGSNEPTVLASGASGDDSIEDYMQRLLKRVRGDSATTEQSFGIYNVESETERTPRTEAEMDLVELKQSRESKPLTQSEYQPRSQAPEVVANFAAMREIGNDHRRKNILNHAERTLTDRTKSGLIGAVAGIGMSVASFFYLDAQPELAATGLFAGLGMAVICIWQAIHSRKKVLRSMQLDREECEAEASAEDAIAEPCLAVSNDVE